MTDAEELARDWKVACPSATDAEAAEAAALLIDIARMLDEIQATMERSEQIMARMVARLPSE